ncbi:hypothetical protein [Sphingobium sp. CECT 9361]|uniref:hypothetical protein n=1 Tax=Sphingobium sp. CECT 9361 TaxID=2845384 RepID=UPI001E4CA686|nr:hypothetical protein [Sphingobium sp. CECT 9361]CAH0356383.1 hypothetical protein SPH9361_04048 [Sphingobium sp. CECT 9361]
MAARFREKDQRPNTLEHLNLADTLVFGFSWMLVMAIGLMPIFETIIKRPPSISMPAVIAFFTAVGSGVVLKRRYSWVGLVLHIFGQILIWLSLFVMSLAIALYARS